MHILLTGGSGDLGQLLIHRAPQFHWDVVDVVPPKHGLGYYHECSILDREKFRQVLLRTHSDMVIHIAGWHGIHEKRGEKNEAEFHELNVVGTQNVLEVLRDLQKSDVQFMHISSTSVESDSVYGRSKREAERVVNRHARLDGFDTLILRPRSFIPHWNRSIYETFPDWAKRFWGGAVHIEDVVGAVYKAIMRAMEGPWHYRSALVLDQKWEYAQEIVTKWEAWGGERIIRNYFGEESLVTALTYGLSVTNAPEVLVLRSTETEKFLRHSPRYGVRELLGELSRYKGEFPPSPYEKQ